MKQRQHFISFGCAERERQAAVSDILVTFTKLRRDREFPGLPALSGSAGTFRER